MASLFASPSDKTTRIPSTQDNVITVPNIPPLGLFAGEDDFNNRATICELGSGDDDNDFVSGGRRKKPKLSLQHVEENHSPKPFTPTKLLKRDGIDTSKRKFFNDPVHSQIMLDALCIRIVDTPEFTRLANLKQLGTCNYVFRGATHTRFEHSLGVAHLAERLARILQQNQPELNITWQDVLCVKISGLCHDLGHGPFSHVFDGVFIKAMYPNGLDGCGSKWKHEDGSVRLFRHILKENNILLPEYGLDQRDQLFIEEIIGGIKGSARRGRGPDKFFLYDIVNNTRSGLDVDKLDYFQRDMRYTNVAGSANFERFLLNARVTRAERIPDDCDGSAPTDMPLMICYPEKMAREAINLFNLRFKMHLDVYTHKTVKQVEYMITDALKLADAHIEIQGES